MVGPNDVLRHAYIVIQVSTFQPFVTKMSDILTQITIVDQPAPMRDMGSEDHSNKEKENPLPSPFFAICERGVKAFIARRNWGYLDVQGGFTMSPWTVHARPERSRPSRRAENKFRLQSPSSLACTAVVIDIVIFPLVCSACMRAGRRAGCVYVPRPFRSESKQYEY